MTAKAWTRWQDRVALVIGVLAALSPTVVATDAAAAWTLGAAWTSWVAGVLAVLVSASALPAATSAHRGLAGPLDRAVVVAVLAAALDAGVG